MADPASFVPVPVVDSWDETPSLRGLALDLGGLGALSSQPGAPGQVLQLRASNGVGYFALANAPQPDGRVELLLKRGGTVADEVIARSRAGTEIEATAPFGSGFPVGEAAGRDVLLFAVGSGISPIRALVQHLIATRERYGKVVLFYGERSRPDFAFAREHERWAAAGVKVVLCASRPADDWEGPRGYVQEVARSHAFAEVQPDGAVAFLCGMKGMVSAARDMLSNAGLPVDRTYLNY
jgi:NAD(P)H-flavin reductase